MKINRISLINFRQYKNVTLEFSYDPQKNVTIILGDNGYGKTTLVKSFLWCLYRDLCFKDKKLLNKDVAMTMNHTDEKTVKVTLELEHDNSIYTIITQESYKRNFDKFGNPLEDEDGNPVLSISRKASTRINITKSDQTKIVPPLEVKNVIEKILRKELSSFLFYDGENNKIENSSSVKKIDSAVYEFMGIQKIMNLQTQFDPRTKNSVIYKLRDSLKSTDVLKINVLKEKKDEKENLKSAQENKIISNEAEIDRLREQLAEKENILDANMDIYQDQREKRSLEKNILIQQKEVDNMLKSVINANNGSSDSLLKSLFAYCYEKNNLSSLQEKSSFNSNTSLSHISVEVIYELINRGYCLCGTKITDESEAKKHLLESKDHMEPYDFGKYLSDFCSSEEVNVEYVRLDNYNVQESCNKFLDHIENIESEKERLTHLKQKIEGSPDIGLYQRQINDYYLQIGRLNNVNDFIQNEKLPQINDELEEIDKLIDEACEDDEENRLTNKCIAYAKAIYRRTFTKIEQSKKILKDSLEENTNEIFQMMYHGDRQIKLNDKFQMQTLSNNQAIDNSTGIETVKNFAFVTALMKTLKEQVFGIDESNDIQNESYPLVIDAPFSNTDERHIQNICATLPKYCNQLIIVVMKKDFEIAKESLSSRIDSIYQIHKISETDDRIEELD